MRLFRWILPLIMVLIWVGGVGPLGQYAGKLSEVQENNNAAYLPAEAESTKVANALASVLPDDQAPAVIVWEIDGEPAVAMDIIVEQMTAILEIDTVVTDQMPADSVLRIIPSGDGQAFQAQVTIAYGTDSEVLRESVSEIRDIIGQSPDGWNVHVTGPAGFVTDLVKAFGQIDGLLLAVALGVVLVILLVVYRSPVLPLVVLTSSILALALASTLVYYLAANDVIDLNGQSQGILFILVIGAATDYALLSVSRFKEELRHVDSPVTAMKKAYRGTFEPIVASGTTVILGLMCLLASGLTSLRGLGPVGAIGIGSSMLAALTFLPALLILIGRKAFWPFVPHVDGQHQSNGLWDRIAAGVTKRPRRIWMITLVGLIAFAAFVPQFKDEGVPQSEIFLVDVDSVSGQEALARHFDAGAGEPVMVLTPTVVVNDVATHVTQAPGIGSVSEPIVLGDTALINAILVDQADGTEGQQAVRDLRASLDDISPDALVGGTTATLIDTLDQSIQDRNTIIPMILAVTLLVLIVLLRSLVAPVVVIVANVLSFGATLGLSALVFNHIFKFPGAEPQVTLLGFVFLVALGIDYTIFLMTRVREESIKSGTSEGIRVGLASTGGVITSAGIVLAATFAALAVLPLLFLAQVAFIVAGGVLIDTLIVRTLLVPAMSYDIGSKIWWPSRLSRSKQH